MKDTVKKYLETKSIFAGKENAVVRENSSFPIAVCIPAFNEYPTIIRTLQSLAVSSAACSVKIQVFVCVNNRRTSPIEAKQNNRLCIEVLRRISENEIADENAVSGVRITVLDCTESGKVFDERQGVGTARKIAMDSALKEGARVIASLDADTLVSEDYCGELKRFLMEKQDFATMNFKHQTSEDADLQKGIDCYEYWMREHSRRLKNCGTPFYHMALGSLIVVSDRMYAQIGGMKNRLAGEDFYFIQDSVKILMSRIKNTGQLPASIENVENLLQGCVPYLSCEVFPETRISDRVLFGTGKSLDRLKDDSGKIWLYDGSSYKAVEDFIRLFNSLNEKGLAPVFPEKVFEKESVINPTLVDFLCNDGFFDSWTSMIKNCRNSPLKNAVSFHCKFDGLKIIRAFHFMERFCT